MKYLLVLSLMLSISNAIYGETSDNTNYTTNEMDTTTSPPPGQGGRTFFLFGGFFRKIRQRWSGQPDPVPLYAGPAFPVAGYYNCPIYGCNPALTYRPAPYEPVNYYNRQPYQYDSVPPPYGIPIPQGHRQQQHQNTQQSNVVIYQNGQQGYYNPSQAGNPPYYQSAPPLPPPPVNYPSIQSGQNYPSGNGGPVVYNQNSPQYPVNSYGHYGPPLFPPATQNFDPIYNQPPTGAVGPLPMHSPPCNPHLFPCQGGG